MPRYVDLDKLPRVGLWRDPEDHGAMVELRDVIQALRQAEAQTGEVATVVHGHWVLTDCGDAMCSRCRESYEICDEQEHARAMMKYFAQEWRWCPHCGAKMDGETQNEKPKG